MINMEIPIEVISAISGAIAGGAVSCIFNYLNDRRKERREDEKEKHKEFQLLFESRPELEIISCEKFSDTLLCDSINKELQAIVVEFDASVEEDVIFANYSPENSNLCEYESVWYKLKNVGKTDISSIALISQNKKHFSIFDKNLADFYIKNRVLKYSTHLDEKVRVGQEFGIEIFYRKDAKYYPSLEIGMQDPNFNFWLQPLFFPSEKIGESRAVEFNEYNEAIKTNVAEECFKRPWLW